MYQTKRSLSTRIALWIAIGMLGGLAAGLLQGIFYPSRTTTSISLIVVCGIGSVLAITRYIMQRRRESPIGAPVGVDNADEESAGEKTTPLTSDGGENTNGNDDDTDCSDDAGMPER